MKYFIASLLTIFFSLCIEYSSAMYPSINSIFNCIFKLNFPIIISYIMTPPQGICCPNQKVGEEGGPKGVPPKQKCLE